MELDLLSVVKGLFAIALTYWSSKTVYNVFFHPLAHFPGPWWATASYLAEFYYDVLQGGQYLKKVIQMHEKYGPLVRVNPDHLSLNDPFFYTEIYSGAGRKMNKHPELSQTVATSVVSTKDHDLHRQRRGYIANMFSKKSISDLENVVQSKVDKLVMLMKQAYRTEETLIGHLMFGSLAVDIISHYAYGESFGDLDKPGLPCELQRDVKGVALTLNLRKFFPAMDAVLMRIPAWLIVRINPSIVSWLDFDNRITRYSIEALKKSQEGVEPAKPRTIFDALLSSKVPEEEKTLQRLKDEGTLILFAGVDTTARFLTCAMCYLLTYPGILAKLRAELESHSSSTLTELEALPYLTAVINESLRFQCCFTGRFPRVVVDPIPYKDLLIPSGTIIGASPYLLNNHPDVFPDPHIFRPERWIEAKARGEYLDKYLVTFSKGSRACLGINLAYAELYLTIAAMVQNFDLELVDSSIENITPDRDFGLAFDKNYNFGVNLRVTKVRKE
ncbi:uncharacterized protein J4E79_005709 [Alternaria viburni]|uniref:uncharacterized protein n=1 Tax=Alternaria viburni TaxID=566460 RepID=UPI0020C21E58|nr:uncharacterized protein J4E79_005709 [Alternaria viburni]KAI4659907.1 hypothetical protein J4E79_005709 [Alternaria viburni]